MTKTGCELSSRLGVVQVLGRYVKLSFLKRPRAGGELGDATRAGVPSGSVCGWISSESEVERA